ncbi:MAG: DUF4215 domain-containing protein [Myxococcota bacterium]
MFKKILLASLCFAFLAPVGAEAANLCNTNPQHWLWTQPGGSAVDHLPVLFENPVDVRVLADESKVYLGVLIDEDPGPNLRPRFQIFEYDFSETYSDDSVLTEGSCQLSGRSAVTMPLGSSPSGASYAPDGTTSDNSGSTNSSYTNESKDFDNFLASVHKTAQIGVGSPDQLMFYLADGRAFVKTAGLSTWSLRYLDASTAGDLYAVFDVALIANLQSGSLPAMIRSSSSSEPLICSPNVSICSASANVTVPTGLAPDIELGESSVYESTFGVLAASAIVSDETNVYTTFDLGLAGSITPTNKTAVFNHVDSVAIWGRQAAISAETASSCTGGSSSTPSFVRSPNQSHLYTDYADSGSTSFNLTLGNSGVAVDSTTTDLRAVETTSVGQFMYVDQGSAPTKRIAARVDYALPLSVEGPTELRDDNCRDHPSGSLCNPSLFSVVESTPSSRGTTYAFVASTFFEVSPLTNPTPLLMCNRSKFESTCGNGVTDGVEECDDGNNVDDDACSNLCIACDKTLCGGTCVDTSSDENFCGDCFTACSTGQECCGGACYDDTHPFNCGGNCNACDSSVILGSVYDTDSNEKCAAQQCVPTCSFDTNGVIKSCSQSADICYEPCDSVLLDASAGCSCTPPL